jgi:hypothetical protein
MVPVVMVPEEACVDVVEGETLFQVRALRCPNNNPDNLKSNHSSIAYPSTVTSRGFMVDFRLVMTYPKSYSLSANSV